LESLIRVRKEVSEVIVGLNLNINDEVSKIHHPCKKTDFLRINLRENSLTSSN